MGARCLCIACVCLCVRKREKGHEAGATTPSPGRHVGNEGRGCHCNGSRLIRSIYYFPELTLTALSRSNAPGRDVIIIKGDRIINLIIFSSNLISSKASWKDARVDAELTNDRVSSWEIPTKGCPGPKK